MEIKQKFERLQELFNQRQAIDVEILQILGEPKTTREKPKVQVQLHPNRNPLRGFTPEEEANIIKLIGIGEKTGTLAKKFKVPNSKMSNFVWKLRKEGKLPPVQKRELDDPEEDNLENN